MLEHEAEAVRFISSKASTPPAALALGAGQQLDGVVGGAQARKGDGARGQNGEASGWRR
jgi:hypothetical protein